MNPKQINKMMTARIFVISNMFVTLLNDKSVVGFGVQGSGFRVQGCGGGFAASIYEAMPENSIQVASNL